MSDRGNPNATHRGAERGWRSRGRGRGGRGIATEQLRESSLGLTRARTPAPQSSKTPASMPVDNVPSRRRMDLMASISRSSGLEKDGDDLKNYKVQEEYRNFIQEKVNDVLGKYPQNETETETEKTQRTNVQQNLLILFRKLREGVASSSRRDAFALEAYETSLYLSILFESPTQSTSIIPHIFPSGKSEEDFSSGPPSVYSILDSLLHQLVTFYPSQEPYHRHSGALPETLLPKNSAMSTWLKKLTSSLRTRNYAKFALLSRRSAVIDMLDMSITPSKTNSANPRLPLNDALGLKATLFLVDALRKKASDSAWAVIRSAYRELSSDKTPKEAGDWLERSLCLRRLAYDDQAPSVESWLDMKASLGHVRRKEGAEGRWIVCKAR